MFKIFLIVLVCLLLGALIAVIRQNRGLEKELANEETEHAINRAGLKAFYVDRENTLAMAHQQSMSEMTSKLFEVIEERRAAQMNLELMLMVNDGASKETIHSYIKEHLS